MKSILLLGIPFVYGYLIKPNQKRKATFKTFCERPYAHRGFYSLKKHIPENSCQAFKRAVKHNLGIELDVQLTKDHKCIILHDYSLLRATGVDLQVDACDYASIKHLTLFDTDQKIPTLQEALDVIQGKVPIIVEVKQKGKNYRLCKEVSKILDRYPGKFMVESFNPYVVYWFKKHRPDYIRGQLSMNLKQDKNMPALLKLPAQYLCFNAILKPDFVAYDVSHKDNLSFQCIHHLYKGNTVLWTIKNKDHYQELKDQYDIMIFERFDPD
ncbi:MAG: glycerophosphodiester phosphodiesterase family protein [Erysipelotrichaceae bacterium]